MASTSLSLAPSFLGNPIEICIVRLPLSFSFVTPSYRTTIQALTALGVGPWRVYTCSPENTTNQTYRGRPSAYTIKFCYASLPPSNITYEVIQPVSGPSIFADYLASHATAGSEGGGGLHHVAYDCNGIPMEERVKKFDERGYSMVQSGTWMEGSTFMFFEGPQGVKGTWVETIEFGGGEWPEAEEWFPEEAGQERGQEAIAKEVKVEESGAGRRKGIE
ncbi:hypothetical protein G7Y79_00022g052480 [Physcia stellaris]|nr:hypothetical protein G7Y79_00022g052480 [Physcia stellaris]